MTVARLTLLTLLGASAGCIDTSLGQTQSVDLPASELAIEPTIIDAEAAPADGRVPVSMQFFHTNALVQLGGGVVSVNGVVLPWTAQGYTGRIPVVAEGGTITFEYTRAGTTADVVFQVPPRPVVTSPATNEVVERSTNVTVTYVSGTSFGVRPIASDAGLGITGGEQSDNGMALLDASTLRSGAGSVGVTRRIVTTPPGSAFQSSVVTYKITSLPTPVTWQ